MTNSDVAFRMGTTHNICQDYGRAGVAGNACYAIISDGCSSSPDTDIGARLIALEAERLVKGMYRHRGEIRSQVKSLLEIGLVIAESVKKISDEITGLPAGHLDATLGIVGSSADERGTDIDAWLFGDGVIVTKIKDTSRPDEHEEFTQVIHLAYQSGYPNYLSYLLDDKRRDSVKHLLNGTLRKWLYSSTQMEPITFVEREHVGPYHYHQNYLHGGYMIPMYVAVMSDGALSFVRNVQTETSKTDLPVALKEVLDELLAFKGYQGVFVQRRMQKFVKDCHAKGWSHHDDLAVGVVSIGLCHER